jgi:hypothetical protein
MFVAAALQEYRARRQQAGDSGRYSAQGLRELEQELTAEAAGIIRQALDDTHLRQNIAQARAKLAPKAAADPLAELLGFWKKMEVRTQLDQLGRTVIDPATGTLSFDTVKGNLLYREARRSQNAFVMEALEEWPRIGGDTPVDPELIAQGQQRRARALDPLAARALVEQEACTRRCTQCCEITSLRSRYLSLTRSRRWLANPPPPTQETKDDDTRA